MTEDAVILEEINKQKGKKAEAIEYLQQAVTLYPQQGNTTEAQRTAATIQQIQQQR